MTEPRGPGDREPSIPKTRTSRLVQGYAALGSLLLLAYVAAGFFGWSFSEDKRDAIPSSVRHSPGGYRSYHFWHTGYHGGK